MRRFGMMALAAAGLCLGSIAAALAAPPQILAPHALLVEAETGSILFEKAADDLVAPASLA
jgi:D-alanyl-D-alanine carboxypeptidase (penicillin-binding protein 5/6)